MVLRFDVGSIKSKHITKEGFLSLEGTVTRIGVFRYKNSDGSIRNELRHPDDVLKTDSLSTMEMIPITLHHPSEKTVNSKNFKKVGVGFTGNKITNDGVFIKTNLKINDQNAINAVENDNIQELSLGYSTVLVPESGEFNGEHYDCRQTEIVYNHLALVDKGRAGPEARLHLDSDDAVQEDNINIDKKEKMMPDLVKVSIGSLNYDAAPEVKIAYETAIKRADIAETELKTKSNEVSTVQAKLDTANETIELAKKEDPQLKIDEAVKTRIDLERIALTHLDSNTKLDGVSNKEIKKQCILKHFPESQKKLDDGNDIYIDARFDAVLEMKTDGRHNDNPPKKGIADQRISIYTKNDSRSKDRIDSVASKQKMEDYLLNSWKPKE